MPKSHARYAPEYRRRMIEAGRERDAAPTSWRRNRANRAVDTQLADAGAHLDEGRRHDGLTSDERQELSRLRRENRILRAEREILIKSRGLVRDGDRFGAITAFEFVSANQAMYKIATMCRVLEVSTSGYYAWCQRSPRRAPRRTRNSVRG